MREDDKIKLFCIPCAAASAMMFSNWSDYLNDNIEVFPLELPGRGLRYKDELITDINALTDDLLELIKDEIVDSNYAILGYCMGSVIAYELYRKIHLNNLRKPKHIFVSASKVPHVQANTNSIFAIPQEEVMGIVKRMLSFRINSESAKNENFLKDFIVMLSPNYTKDLDKMSDKEIINEMSYFEDKCNVKDEELKSIAACKRLVTILKYDSLMLHNYQVQEPLIKFDSDVTAMIGEFDTVISMSEVNNWKNYSNKQFGIEKIRGGHLFMFDNFIDTIRVINNKIGDTGLKGKNKNE